MAQQLSTQHDSLSDELRHLDDRKCSLSWAGTKGFFRELFKEGAMPVIIAAAAGAIVGGVAFTLGTLTVLPVIELAAIPSVAAAGAILTASVIGGRGAIEDINIARVTNANIDLTIGETQLRSMDKSPSHKPTYHSTPEHNGSWINATGGISHNHGSHSKNDTTPTTSLMQGSIDRTAMGKVFDKMERSHDTVLH